MKKYIHINQHIIRRNKSNGYNEPVITVKTYKSNNYGHSVEVNGPCKIVYSPDKPLSCGARVWIETDASVSVTDSSPAGHTKEVAWELNTTILCRGLFRTTARCRMPISGAVGNFLKSWATSNKPQASSNKRGKLDNCLSPDYVLKTDLTERYNYEYKRSFKNCGRFK